MALAKNLASGTLAESISASTTTLLVYVGEGSASTIKGVWPNTPFYATIMPSSPSAGVPNSLDSEIVKVTAVGTDMVGNTTLTVVRGQKGTTAKAFSADAVVTNGIFMDDILNRIYPIGSIFMSVSHSTVAQVEEALGGTWEAWGAGRVPVGVDTTQTEFNTVLKTGGEKTHTLVNNELPKISASFTMHGQETGTEFYRKSGYATGDLISNKYKTIANHATGASSYGDPGISFGNDGAHNNLQPYITCYMYKRTG